MRSRKLASGLHMGLQVPEHAERDVGDVDNVGAEGDWSFGVWAVDALGRQRLHESSQILVKREQSQ